MWTAAFLRLRPGRLRCRPEIRIAALADALSLWRGPAHHRICLRFEALASLYRRKRFVRYASRGTLVSPRVRVQ